MQLRALRDIPSSVGAIAKGSVFNEHNPVQAQEWINTGYAEELKKANSRGWNGLAWDNATVAILASGESLTQQQADTVFTWREYDQDKRKVIVVNTTYQRAPWADLLYACDGPWWTHYIEDVRRIFKGQLWTQEATKAAEYGLNFIPSRRGNNLCRDVGAICQGENSGFQSIGLAYWSGASRVYLLGYDMRGKHWHPDHPGTLNKVNRYDTWLQNYEQLAKDCAAIKFEVINCTPRSALKSFPKRNWQEVFV